MPFDLKADVRTTFGTARCPQSVMLIGSLSQGVFPQPSGGPSCVPAKYAAEVRIWSFMLMPIAFTERWMIWASCGISPVFSVVSVMLNPRGRPAFAMSCFAVFRSLWRCGMGLLVDG